MASQNPNSISRRSFAILRIAFGVVWLIDAALKWSPAFLNNFSGYLAGAASGQPGALAMWINFWIAITNINPHAFALAVAIAETALALSLISGILSKYAMYAGIILSLIVWSTAEGFGGPYVAGATDIGCAVIYAFVFVALILGEGWKELTVWK